MGYGGGAGTILRGLARRPGFTATAIGTLALGIGANVGLFSVVRSVILAPLPFPDSDRLVQVWESDVHRPVRSLSPADFLDLKERTGTLQDLAAWDESDATLDGVDRALRIRAASVSSNFFRTLGVEADRGRAFEGAEGTPAVVLSDGLWRREFGGDPGTLGAVIRLDGRPHEVVGVMPRDFDFPAGADLWIRAPRDVPVGLGFPGDITTVRDAWYFQAVGRIAPGRDLEAASAEMDALAAALEREHPEVNEGLGIRLVPLKEELVGPVRGTLLLLLGATALVLLVACANVANLLLGRATDRSRELAIRQALGAGRGRLVRYVLGESMALGAGGAAAGALLAWGGVALLRDGLGPLLPPGATIDLDLWALGYAATVAVVCAGFFGGLPAWLAAARVDGIPRDGSRGATDGRLARTLGRGLVTAEVAMAVTLVLGATLLLRSLDRLQRVDPGFEAPGLTLASVALPAGADGEVGSPEPAAVFEAMAAEVAALPGVLSAGWTQRGPLELGPGAGLRTFAGGPEEWAAHDLPGVRWQVVDPGYFATLGVPLIAGRGFESGDDARGEPVALVNAAFVRAVFGDADAVGRLVNTGLDGRTPDGDWRWVRIVGVVADTRNRGPAAEPEPVLFRPMAQGGPGFRGDAALLVVRAGSGVPGLAEALRERIERVVPGAPVYRVTSGESLAAPYAADRRLVLGLLGTFAVLALALGTVGVYAVTAGTVARRTREVGVRMALGADRRRVVGLVLSQGMLPVLAGLALGLGAATLGGRLAVDLLFEVSPADPVSLLAVTGLLLATALAATWVPARRASRVDPVRAIREE